MSKVLNYAHLERNCKLYFKLSYKQNSSCQEGWTPVTAIVVDLTDPILRTTYVL